MRVRFVKADPDDAPTLIRVQKQALFEDYCKCGGFPGYDQTAAELASAMVAEGVYSYCVLLDERPGGLIIARDMGGNRYRLERLCIAPQHEHRGIGRRALAFIERALPDAEFVELEVPAFKRRVLTFCRKSGYVQVTRRSANGIEWLRLERRLTRASATLTDGLQGQLVCIGALPRNGEGQALLVKTEDGGWTFPTGVLTRGESVSGGVTRVVRQYCGVSADADELAAMYSILPEERARAAEAGDTAMSIAASGALMLDFNCVCRSEDIILAEDITEASWFSDSMARLIVEDAEMATRLATLLDYDGHVRYSVLTSTRKVCEQARF